jgi:hypothetical protein
MIKREATCGCGQLMIVCTGEPTRVSMCHCFACQRRTGSTFGVQAWFPRDAVSINRGVGKQYERRADSGRMVILNFCPNCGTTIYWTAEQRPDLIAVAVGTFADPSFQMPRHSVWEKRQHPWITSIAEQQIEHSD